MIISISLATVCEPVKLICVILGSAAIFLESDASVGSGIINCNRSAGTPASYIISAINLYGPIFLGEGCKITELPIINAAIVSPAPIQVKLKGAQTPTTPAGVRSEER